MVLDHCFSTWGSRSPEPFRCVLKGSSLQDFHFMVSSQLALQHVLPSCISHVHLFVTPWTIAHQAPLSMGSSRQEYWSGLPCPLPGDLLHPRIEPKSHVAPALWADSLPLVPPGKPHGCLVTQLCLSLCNPIDCPCQAPLWMGILQAEILEWVAMPSSRESSQPRNGTQASHIAG